MNLEMLNEEVRLNHPVLNALNPAEHVTKHLTDMALDNQKLLLVKGGES
jgi:hypothetical protein